MTLIRIVVCLGVVVACAQAQAIHGADGERNPYRSEEDVASGARLFRSHCSACHGLAGEGDRAPSLETGAFRHGSSDEDLFATISNGVPGTEMPGTFFQGKQVWQLTAYVRSLSEGRGAEQATGDPAAGRSLFFGKGGCSSCHVAEGRGGRGGPDLHDVGGSRSLTHLRESMVDPGAKVLPRDRWIRATGYDGAEYSGLRLNEGTFTVQVLEIDGNLLSLAKEDLEKFEVRRDSAMPSYRDRLSEKEIDDLTAYLAGLRR